MTTHGAQHEAWLERRKFANMLWGPLAVTAIAHVEGRGYILDIETEARRQPLQVYVTEKGHSIRVWRDGKELK